VNDPVALVSYAVLVGLTPLIPLPVLDEYVHTVLERRLVAAVARAHGVAWSDEEVRALVDDETSVMGGIARKAFTFPVKLLFRKAFLVLQIKRASDEASLAYHRGYLVNRAVAQKIVAPLGPRSMREVRKAIDTACEKVPISPLASALAGVFRGSVGALEAIGKALVGRIKRAGRRMNESDVATAVEDTAEKTDLVARVRAAIGAVPREHFDALDHAFDQALEGTSP
jgi:hypothetical protein